MPKLELGDLKSVTQLKDKNIPALYEMVKAGNVIIAAVPSCVLMFKQELPLMFPDDEKVLAVGQAFFDPFEYLHKLHKAGQVQYRVQEYSRQRQLSRGMPPARAKHRPKDETDSRTY